MPTNKILCFVQFQDKERLSLPHFFINFAVLHIHPPWHRVHTAFQCTWSRAREARGLQGQPRIPNCMGSPSRDTLESLYYHNTPSVFPSSTRFRPDPQWQRAQGQMAPSFKRKRHDFYLLLFWLRQELKLKRLLSPRLVRLAYQVLTPY